METGKMQTKLLTFFSFFFNIIFHFLCYGYINGIIIKIMSNNN